MPLRHWQWYAHNFFQVEKKKCFEPIDACNEIKEDLSGKVTGCIFHDCEKKKKKGNFSQSKNYRGKKLFHELLLSETDMDKTTTCALAAGCWLPQLT